jgi:hypothetical protein
VISAELEQEADAFRGDGQKMLTELPAAVETDGARSRDPAGAPMA